MKKEIEILIVDSCPMAVKGIKTTLLTDIIIGNSIDVKTVYTYEETLCLNNKCWNNENNFDVIIINVDINFKNSRGMVFGEKYITKIRDHYPNAKIIAVILTRDNYRIYNIMMNIKPEGFIVQNELVVIELQTVISAVIKCEIYYSKTIFSIVKKNKKLFDIIDDVDRAILHYLDRGIKTTDLHKYVLRSTSTIEKRIRKMKNSFVPIKGCCKELLEEARTREII